jgi:hypothetical protein
MTLAHQFPTQLSESGPRGKRLFRSVMVNTHSKVVMGLEDRTEIEPLAEWLFTGSIDTEAVKFDLKTRGVLGEVETRRRVVTRGSSSQESLSKSSSSAESASQTLGLSRGESISASFDAYREEEDSLWEQILGTLDPEPEEEGPAKWKQTESESQSLSLASGKSASLSETEGVSVSQGESFSESFVPFLERQWGEQLSSRQFRAVEEQYFQYVQRIFNLRRREAIVRLADEKKAGALRTLDVPDSEVSDRIRERYRVEQLAKWSFVLPREAAQAALDIRRNDALVSIRPAGEEPEAFDNARRTNPEEPQF